MSPAAFYDLPREMFPIIFIAFDAAGREVWREVVEGPAALEIPALAQTHGKVRVRVEFGNGAVAEADQEGV
jgi:hypothetical protein